MRPAFVRYSRGLEVLGGLGLIVLVGLPYADGLRFHRWPPGHPWLAISIVAMGLSAMLWPSTRIREAPRGQIVTRLSLVLVATGAAVMCWHTWPPNEASGL